MKKSGQNEAGFSPSPGMLKLLEAAVNPEVDASISAWCEASGVSRAQWYRWRAQEGFLIWFNGGYQKALEGVRVALVKVGLQKALAGDFQFWKVMMEKTGEYAHEMKIKTEPPVIISITDKQYEKIREGAERFGIQ